MVATLFPAALALLFSSHLLINLRRRACLRLAAGLRLILLLLLLPFRCRCRFGFGDRGSLWRSGVDLRWLRLRPHDGFARGRLGRWRYVVETLAT